MNRKCYYSSCSRDLSTRKASVKKLTVATDKYINVNNGETGLASHKNDQS